MKLNVRLTHKKVSMSSEEGIEKCIKVLQQNGYVIYNSEGNETVEDSFDNCEVLINRLIKKHRGKIFDKERHLLLKKYKNQCIGNSSSSIKECIDFLFST